jgi:hypothetical protein
LLLLDPPKQPRHGFTLKTGRNSVGAGSTVERNWSSGRRPRHGL